MNRSPEGKFIDRGAMLSAWLPKMLELVYCQNSLSEMLGVASSWCLKRASREYQRAGEMLAHGNDPEYEQRYAQRRSEDAARWFARKAVLLKAKAELEAIR